MTKQKNCTKLKYNIVLHFKQKWPEHVYIIFQGFIIIITDIYTINGLLNGSAFHIILMSMLICSLLSFVTPFLISVQLLVFPLLIYLTSSFPEPSKEFHVHICINFSWSASFFRYFLVSIFHICILKWTPVDFLVLHRSVECRSNLLGASGLVKNKSNLITNREANNSFPLTLKLILMRTLKSCQPWKLKEYVSPKLYGLRTNLQAITTHNIICILVNRFREEEGWNGF